MIFIKTQACYSGNNVTLSLRASSPVWASETGLARTREARFACPNRRACSQAMYVTLCAGARHSSLGDYFWIPVGHFRVPPGLCIKTRLGAQPFLWRWVLFAWEWKIISIACSISKVEHLTSFWYRGPGENRKWPISLRPSIWLTD